MKRAFRIPIWLFFWVVPFVSFYVTYPSIPHQSTQVSLLIAAVAIGLSATLGYFDYPIIGTPFFLLLLANYWLSYFVMPPLYVTILVFIGLTVIGLLTRKMARATIDRTSIISWIILGFMVAQINSLLFFWPFSFIENSLISFITYYAFWQLFQQIDYAPRRAMVGHVVFTIASVIVVIGAILWVNYPHLRSF